MCTISLHVTCTRIHISACSTVETKVTAGPQPATTAKKEISVLLGEIIDMDTEIYRFTDLSPNCGTAGVQNDRFQIIDINITA